MPRAAELNMLKTARRRHYGKARTRRYVYGGMRHKLGWRPSRERRRGSMIHRGK